MPANGARALARERGKTRYAGKPCRHAHGRERFTSNGNCVECDRLSYIERANELQKSWRNRNPEKAREIGRRSESKRRLNAELESFVAAMEQN